MYKVLGTRLDISNANHPYTDGQTKRSYQGIGDILRSICADTLESWSSMSLLLLFG